MILAGVFNKLNAFLFQQKTKQRQGVTTSSEYTQVPFKYKVLTHYFCHSELQRHLLTLFTFYNTVFSLNLKIINR